MSSTINVGIDLGTTNSAIARFVRGDVEVFVNPADFGRTTLPSVVGYRKDRIFVGSKARELVEKRPQDVVSVFKRKMGTAETFPIEAIARAVSPVELSAHVLKELKGFVQSGETLDAAVITIPASFDTIQSNATKEAGHQAGFQQVVLLQEPIAASLAYANKSKAVDLTDGQWLVYDLGGGTFDVALMRTQGGEMKVLDHEGDNYLGGSDFDRMIVESFVFPRLRAAGAFADLDAQMKGRSGRLNRAYAKLLLKAEQAKIHLSGGTSAEIEAEDVEDDDGEPVSELITVTRAEFERLIQPAVDRSIEMVRAVLTRKNLTARDLQFVLMVGGSTYIPYVRRRVGEVLGIPVNTDVDPTTAVAVGAAYYAGTKPKAAAPAPATDTAAPARLRVKLAYHKVSQDTSELLAARFDGDIEGLGYRLTRDDAGFDTGLKPLTAQVAEELPLVPNAYNFFTLTVTDGFGNPVETGVEPVGIAQGKYGVIGQPLPHDIAIEKDDFQDLESPATRLHGVFGKNEVLPLRRTVTFALNRTIPKGSAESVHIRVLEGPSHLRPDSNQCIGHLSITGAMLARDAVKGSDVEVTLEMSESRDLTMSAYLAMTDQEFREVFQPKQRSTPKAFLVEQIARTTRTLDEELEAAIAREDYEAAEALRPLQRDARELRREVDALIDDDVTDLRYQLEDRTRTLARRIDEATKEKRVQKARQTYEEAKRLCYEVIDAGGNAHERHLADAVVAQEPAFLTSSNPMKVTEKVEELEAVTYTILRRSPDFQQRVFHSLTNELSRMNDPEQAQNLVAAGRYAIENADWHRLAEVNYALYNLLPRHATGEGPSLIGFGF